MAQRSEEAARRRGPGRPFKPGQSGNPGGRPKGLASHVREVAPPGELVRYYAAIWARNEPELAILGISLEAVTLAERNKAGEWLTERGYGKAPAFQPVEGENPLELDSLDGAIGEIVDELAPRRQTPPAEPIADRKMAGTG